MGTENVWKCRIFDSRKFRFLHRQEVCESGPDHFGGLHHFQDLISGLSSRYVFILALLSPRTQQFQVKHCMVFLTRENFEIKLFCILCARPQWKAALVFRHRKRSVSPEIPERGQNFLLSNFRYHSHKPFRHSHIANSAIVTLSSSPLARAATVIFAGPITIRKKKHTSHLGNNNNKINNNKLKSY